MAPYGNEHHHVRDDLLNATKHRKVRAHMRAVVRRVGRKGRRAQDKQALRQEAGGA